MGVEHTFMCQSQPQLLPRAFCTMQENSYAMIVHVRFAP